MKKDPAVFLGHIMDSIELIESYSKGMTETDLMRSIGLQDQTGVYKILSRFHFCMLFFSRV